MLKPHCHLHDVVGLCPKTCGACQVKSVESCDENNGGCEQVCLKNGDTIKCQCREGFNLKSDKKSCKDVDECESDVCSGYDEECVNTAGSYECESIRTDYGFLLYGQRDVFDGSGSGYNPI